MKAIKTLVVMSAPSKSFLRLKRFLKPLMGLIFTNLGATALGLNKKPNCKTLAKKATNATTNKKGNKIHNKSFRSSKPSTCKLWGVKSNLIQCKDCLNMSLKPSSQLLKKTKTQTKLATSPKKPTTSILLATLPSSRAFSIFLAEGSSVFSSSAMGVL